MITVSVTRMFWAAAIWMLVWYIIGRVTGIRYAENKAEMDLVLAKMEKIHDLKYANYELKTALSIMLCAWDHCSQKLTEFLQDHTAESAEAYSEAMPNLFYAASIGRRALKENGNESSSHPKSDATDRT